MATSYPAQLGTDNLPARLLSFHNWLCKLSVEKGYCWASTPYLAQKQRAHESTVYRWLAELKQRGYIQTETDAGIERRITPLRPPEKLRGTPHRFIQTAQNRTDDARGKQGKLARGNARGLPYYAYTQETTTNAGTGASASTQGTPERLATARDIRTGAPNGDEINTPGAALVAAMEQIGVTRLRAAELVRVHGLELVQRQLDALPFRKAREAAAVLVKSIKESWNLPERVTEGERRKKQDAQRRQTAALRAALERKETQTRETLLADFSGQSDAIKAQYRDRAARLIRKETPLGMKIPTGGMDRLIESRALELFADSGGGSG